MIKKGDILFGTAIAFLLSLIVMLLFSLPFETIRFWGAVSFLVCSFVFIVGWILLSRRPFSRELEEIEGLLETAEEMLDKDLRLSVRAYREIKRLYPRLKPHEKQRVFGNVLRLYVSILEKLHLRRH